MEKIATLAPPELSISVVSHGQINLVADLLQDIQRYCSGLAIELILTLNIKESLPFLVSNFSFPVQIIQNSKPMGFGANHNQAFRSSTGPYFCVLNPDIRLQSNPFPSLLQCLNDDMVGVSAPLVFDNSGDLEDSARHFPTPWLILKKVFGLHQKLEYGLTNRVIDPDWVGGMFLVFRRTVFESLQGFDERYFLYYEDVDLCGRLRLVGYRVVINPDSKAVHCAQRTSHRSLKFLRWHVTSILRFFLSPVYRQLRRSRIA